MKGTGGDGGGGGAPGGDGDVFGMHIEWYSLSTSQTHCGLPQHTVGPVYAWPLVPMPHLAYWAAHASSEAATTVAGARRSAERSATAKRIVCRKQTTSSTVNASDASREV